MFRSSTILKELIQNLAKVTLLVKHSVKLRHCILCGMWQHVVKRRVCCLLCRLISLLPHFHTMYIDVILLNVLTEE